MNHKFIVLSSLLLLTATSSMAMSLGRHSSAALIGRPLDMSVQAVLGPQDDLSNLCLEADIFYADTKLDKSRVRVTLEKATSAAEQVLIRIRSTALIDEPVVTVYLRAGCQLKTERRYVSLAELPEAEPDRRAQAAVPAALPLRSAVAPSVSAATLIAGPVSPTASEPRRSRLKTAATAAPVKARLKLEPFDLTIERDPQLKSSAQLLSIPAADPQERAAASALWRALSAQPQDILRDTEKFEALENSVRGLQAQTQKTLLSVDELNLKLQKAQDARYANPLVYGLIAMLLLAVAGLVSLLKGRLPGRSSKPGGKPWWRKNGTYESQQQAWIDSTPSEHLQPGDRHEGSRSSLTADKKSSLLDVDVDFDLDLEGVRSRGMRATASPAFVDSIPVSLKDRSDFGVSSLQPSRTAKAEELFDVQQQADFFVSINQHAQAIEVLRSHIGEHKDTSALIYLDLFNLYHQLERPADYESLRQTFNERFNTQVPSFKLYTDKNLGLEAYQHALSRIEALWPSPKVLEVIEESLFRRPDSNIEAFNLEAYRELLMLYSVAREIISPESKAVITSTKLVLPDPSGDKVGARPMPFKATAIQPLSASMDAMQQALQDPAVERLTASVIPPISRRLGLDINLNDLSAPVAILNPLPASDNQYFADFDADATAVLPAINASQLPPDKASKNTDNLIDFDIFDGPAAPSDKSAPFKI